MIIRNLVSYAHRVDKMKWINVKDKVPLPGDKIIAKLKGCKIADYISMEIREGEGLGHIDSWKYAKDKTGKEKCGF